MVKTILVAVVLLVASCGVVPDPLELAVGEAASAASSAALALEQRDDGRMPGPTARTMVDDALREVAGSSRSAASATVPASRSDQQDVAVEELAGLVRHLHDAVDAVGTPRALAVAERLRADAATLGRLEERIRTSS